MDDVRSNAARRGCRTLFNACCGLLFVLVAAPTTNGLAQAVPATGSHGTASVVSATDDLATKRAKVAERIGKLSESTSADANAATNAAAETSEAAEELDLLRALELLFVQQQATLEHRHELEAEQKRLADELETLRALGPSEAKPYSFLLLEDIRDQLSAEMDRQESTAADLDAAKQMLEGAREEFDEAESERREAREALEDNEDDDKKGELTHELRLAELNSSLAQETVALRRAEIEVKTLRQTLNESRRELLDEKIAKIEKDVRFTERDYRSRHNELTRQKDELRRALKEVERHLQQLEGQQAALVRTATEGAASKNAAVAAREAFQVARRVQHEQITLLRQRIGELDHYRHFLGCRYEVASGTADKDNIADWREQLAELLERLSQTERSLMLRLDEIRVDQATLYRKLQQAAEQQDAAQAPWIELQATELRKLVECCELGLVQLKTGQRMLQRFADDLDAAAETTTGGPTWYETTSESLSQLWHYEIAAVDDRPITIGKIISGIFYLALGVLASRLISRLIGRSVLPRLGLNEGASHAVQSILFYSLSVVCGLLSLELVNLPFAAFTFLGGAVAIGIGFGSQNILNNFFSGLILLAEQPIRVGDLVEIDAVCGTVEHIGARSTRIKTAANHEIIVPNSKLLENKVTNLTLSDNLVQTAIGVSLNPVLPIDEVRRLLLGAAQSHPRVLRQPEPVVLLKEFSGEVLVFELHFWLKLSSPMESRMVESDLRERVSHLFHDADAATTSVHLGKAA